MLEVNTGYSHRCFEGCSQHAGVSPKKSGKIRGGVPLCLSVTDHFSGLTPGPWPFYTTVCYDLEEVMCKNVKKALSSRAGHYMLGKQFFKK